MTCLKLYIKIFCVCIDGGWHPTPLLLPGKSHGWRSLVGCSPWVAKSWPRLSDFTSTFHFHALEKEMATHSSVLAWRVPGTGKPGGLPSMGSHRVGHDWSDLAVINFTNLNWNWCQRPQIGTSPEVFKHTWIYIFLQKQKHPQTLSLPLLLISLLGGFGPN